MRRITDAVASTTGDVRIIGGIGGFAGMVELPAMKEPVLVSATDGVGTKVLIAEAMEQYDTVGIDLVAMSVNDLLVTGARPLFFLDYMATGKLDPEKAVALVEGIAAGCRLASCALVGGETAEMPDLYQGGHFDLAGFAVGVVEKSAIIDGSSVKAGDMIVGLPSSGIHSNGFSLVRKILDVNSISYNDKLEQLGVGSIGQLLLTPTEIYVKPVAALAEETHSHAMAHITGGGLPDNISRVIPDGLRARIDRSNWLPPALFATLQDLGNVDDAEMYRTFNMGVGFVTVLSSEDTKKAGYAAPGAFIIGEVIKATGTGGKVEII